MHNFAKLLARVSLVAALVVSVAASAAKVPAESLVTIICKWNYCDSSNLRYCAKIIVLNDANGTASLSNYDNGKLYPIMGAVVTKNEVKWDQEGTPTQPDSEIGVSTHREYFTISRVNGEYRSYSLFRVGNELLTRDDMMERSLNGMKSGKHLAYPAGIGNSLKGNCEPYKTKF